MINDTVVDTAHNRMTTAESIPNRYPFLEVFDPQIVDELVALNQLADQPDTEAYWQRCCELIQKYTRAEAVGLFLFHSHSSIPELLLRTGEFTHERLARVERWEVTLRSSPTDEFQATAASEITLGVGRRTEDLPIIHMRLRIDGFLYGGISLIFSGDHLPREDEYEALSRFVHLLVDGGLRVRQTLVTRQRLDQISLIAQVSQSLNSTLDLKTVLQETTEMTAYVLQAQAATLFLADEHTNELVFYVPTGSAGGLLREMRIPMSQGVVGWVATNRESIIVNDVRKDDRFSSQVDAETGFQTQNILCVPLLVQGRLIGVLEVLNKENDAGFTEEDQNWLETMANQAAIALENARLYQNLRSEQERIIKAQEEIQHQLARDLHDGPAQMLALIIMNVDVSRRLLDRERYATVRSELDLLEDLARQANREIRTLLFELRPIILESQGLIPALRSYHQQLSSSMNCAVHLEVDELPYPLDRQAASNIFSIVQEAINNIRKHAEAQNIWVRVNVDEENLCFEVEDDGVGFNVGSTQDNYENSGSFGLLNMHERAEMIGGKLTIVSPSPRIKRGTLLQGVAPVAQIRRRH